MFYSGWRFPTPQRIISSGTQQEASCFVQETCSPGISLIHFLPPGVQHGASGSAGAQRREPSGRIHLKSDVPIHPHSGVFYFEVEVRSITAPTENNGSNSSVEPSEPGLVVGICRESLSPHTLPGEETPSIGLFTAQRMVYANGKTEGDVIRFPAGPRQRNSGAPAAQDDRRSRGIKVGDRVGCIVNLIDGTVRFTFNSELLSVVVPLMRRFPKHGYYPAVGLFRLVPSVCLRVIFQPSGRPIPIPRPHSNAPNSEDANASFYPPPLSSSSAPQASPTTTAAGYFAFDLNKYCEDIAEELVHMQRRRVAETTAESNECNSCSCRDASIVAAIRKHFMVRGMTKTLSAFEREQKELQCPTAHQAEKAMNVTEETCAAKADDTRRKASKISNCGCVCGGGSSSSSSIGEKAAAEARNRVYTLHIQKLREDISRGDMLSSTQCILASGVLSPVTQEKLAAAVEDTDSLPSEFWGLAFFAQRQDILFLLRAGHVVEMAFDSMEKELHELLTSVRGTGEQRGTSPPATTITTTTTTGFVEMALSFLVEPFEKVSAAVRQHQRCSATGLQTLEEAAFGVFNDSLAADGSKWPSDDLVAHLFFLGKDALWSGPEVPITLLVRRSVPSVPPPKPRKQRGIVQMLSMLVSHQRAVCARVQEEHTSTATYEWIEDWLALLYDVRAQYRARCWCLLLHAIEDFNGALEHRLLVWRRKHERDLQEAKKGGTLRPQVLMEHQHEDGGKWLFPSLRAAWRHAHAAAALEPLFQVVTKAFSDRLHRATTNAQLSTAAEGNKTMSGFGSGLKRSLSFMCDFLESEDLEENANGSRVADGATSTVSQRLLPGTKKNVSRGATMCYGDDVRLSFLYMNSVYKSVFS